MEVKSWKRRKTKRRFLCLEASCLELFRKSKPCSRQAVGNGETEPSLCVQSWKVKFYLHI